MRGPHCHSVELWICKSPVQTQKHHTNCQFPVPATFQRSDPLHTHTLPIPVTRTRSAPSLCPTAYLTIPFRTRASNSFRFGRSNAAAYSSASALLLTMIFCFRVYAFKACSPSITTPALDDFRVSLQPAQSRVRKRCYLFKQFSRILTLVPLPLAFQVSGKPLQLDKTLLSGFDILWHNSFTMNVMSARSWLRNKHLATCDLYLWC